MCGPLRAWGVVAYELLAGAHPFAGKTGTAQLIAVHIAETPREIIDLAPRIPRDVAALVMQCLAKASSDRPESAAAVRTRLEHVVMPSGEGPVEPRPRALRARVVVPALVLLAVVAWAAIRERTGTSPLSNPTTAAADSAAPVRSLVVLPFEGVGGDTANAYFAGAWRMNSRTRSRRCLGCNWPVAALPAPLEAGMRPHRTSAPR